LEDALGFHENSKTAMSSGNKWVALYLYDSSIL
jgi:hypothetical protein